MPGSIATVNDLKHVREGQLVSSKAFNALIDVVSRALKVRGPNTLQGLSGTYVIGGGRSGGGDNAKCVLRSLDTVAKTVTVQKVVWDKYASKLDGEAKFPHHLAAVGAVFDATPLPGGTYEQFNIQYAVRPIDEAGDPENLANAPLWWYNSRKEMWLFFNWPENIRMKDPNAEEVGGGGV